MMTTDAQLMSQAFHLAHRLSSWSPLDGSIGDESAPSRTTPFPSSNHPPSTDLNPSFDPALCVTPERTFPASSRVPLHCPVPTVSEGGCELDHRATKVHFDHTVSVHHLSPEYGSNGASPDDYRLSDLNADSLFSTCSELNTSDVEPISVIASDLCRLSPNSMSLLDELESSRSLQRNSSTGKHISGDGTRKKKKSKPSSSIRVVTERGNTGTLATDSVVSCQDAESTAEAECVLAKPEWNSTLRMSNEITQLQKQEFDLEKISPKLKQQVFEKACLKVNPDTVVYPNLISLEVSEADVLIRAADEQASRVRSSDAAAGDKIKPEDKITRAPDIMDFFTSDLQKESPSVNLVAIPSFQLAPQTAELDRAFDLYRHIRTWDNS